MRPAPNPGEGKDGCVEQGSKYFTELTVQYVEDLDEAKFIGMEEQGDRTVVWFEYEAMEMSASVYLDFPAICIGTDTRIPFTVFQQNAAWILRACADFGLGIDLDVDADTGETWTFLFLRVFWAGYNIEVLQSACDDLRQCRRALEERLGGGEKT